MKKLFPVISVFCVLIYVHFCEGATTTTQNLDRHSLRTSAISENEPDVQSLSVPRGTEKKLRTSGYRSPRAGPLRRERPLCTSSTDRVEPIKRIHVAPVRITKNRKQDNLGTDASATDKPPRKVRYVYKRRRIANQADKPSDKKDDKVNEAKTTTPAPASSPAPEVTLVSGNKSEEVAEVHKKPEERRPIYKKKGSSTTPAPASSTLNPEEFSEESNKDDMGDPSLFPKQNEEKSTTEEKNTQARGKGEAKSVMNNPSTVKTLKKDSMDGEEQTDSSGGSEIRKNDDDKVAEDKKAQRSGKRKNRRISTRHRSASSNERLSRRRSNNDEDET